MVDKSQKSTVQGDALSVALPSTHSDRNDISPLGVIPIRIFGASVSEPTLSVDLYMRPPVHGPIYRKCVKAPIPMACPQDCTQTCACSSITQNVMCYHTS